MDIEKYGHLKHVLECKKNPGLPHSTYYKYKKEISTGKYRLDSENNDLQIKVKVPINVKDTKDSVEVLPDSEDVSWKDMQEGVHFKNNKEKIFTVLL